MRRRKDLASLGASMKVPPKRKGNADSTESYGSLKERLYESPSEKEGKLVRRVRAGVTVARPQ